MTELEPGFARNTGFTTMAAGFRRPSAFPAESEVSLSETDELRLKSEGRDREGWRRRKRTLSVAERRRRIAQIFVLGFTDMFGVSMIIPLLPVFIRNLGASPSLGGLIGSIYGAMQVFSGPVMGKMSDVYGRKTMLLLCYLGPAVSYCAIGLTGSLLVLILARIPTGIFKHGIAVSKAYLADIVDSKDLQSLLGYFNACNGMGFIFGPLVGGYLADWDPSLSLSMLVCGVVFVVNFLLVALLLPSVRNESNKTHSEVSQRDDSTLESKKTSNDIQVTDTGNSVSTEKKKLVIFSPSQMLSTINIFKGDIWYSLSDLILLRFLMTFAVIMFRNNFPVFVKEHFSVDHKTLGLIISISGVASTLAGVTSGWVSKFYSNHAKQILHAMMLLAVSILLTTLSPIISTTVILLLPMSVATANLRICFLSVMLQRGGKDQKGEIVGIGNSVVALSRMIVPSLVGVAQEYSSEFAGYISFCFAVLAVGTLWWVGLKDHKKVKGQ